MKRFILIFLALALCAGLCACWRSAETGQSIATPSLTPTPTPTPAPTPVPTPTPDPELAEALAKFDAIDLSLFMLSGDGGFVTLKTGEVPGIEATNEQLDAFVQHMIGEGYEFLPKFQEALLSREGLSDLAQQLYYDASYRIQTCDFVVRMSMALDVFEDIGAFYDLFGEFESGESDPFLERITLGNQRLNEALFLFFYGDGRELTDAAIEYMIAHDLGSILATSLESMKSGDTLSPSVSGARFFGETEKLLRALIAYEKSESAEAEALLSAFERDMAAGAYNDKIIEGYAAMLQLSSLDNVPKIKAKITSDTSGLTERIAASPRVAAAFESYPAENDGAQSITASTEDLPKGFVAANPHKGRYFILIDAASERNATFAPSKIDSLELTLKSGEKLRSVNNPNEAQIILIAKYTYKYHTTYYTSSRSSSLKIYRATLTLTANDAVTGKKLASASIKASVKSQYTANPGSLYVSDLPSAEIEKFAKKLLTAAGK